MKTLPVYMFQWNRRIAAKPDTILPNNTTVYSLAWTSSALFPLAALTLLAGVAVGPVALVVREEEAVVGAGNPKEVKGIPFEMVDVVRQFDEDGMDAGALGVTVTPTV